MLVYDVEAKDSDRNDNGIIDYGFYVNGVYTTITNEFRINPITGVIRAEKVYDRETRDRYLVMKGLSYIKLSRQFALFYHKADCFSFGCYLHACDVISSFCLLPVIEETHSWRPRGIYPSKSWMLMIMIPNFQPIL